MSELMESDTESQAASGASRPTEASLHPAFPGGSVRCPRCGARLLSETSSSCPSCGVDPRSEAARSLLVREGNRVHELLRGASYVLRGAVRLVTNPRLLALAAIPILLNVAFVAGIAFFVMPPVREWLRYATSPDIFADWVGWWRVPRYALELTGWLVRVAPFVVMPALFAWILATPPVRVIFSAVGTYLSERMERAFLREAGEETLISHMALERSMATAVFSSLVLSASEVAVYCILMPLALVPAVGTFAWLVGPRAVFAGIDDVDPTLSRKHYALGEKLALVSARRWRFLGFGAALIFLTGFPVLNAFVLPAASVGGALLYLELDCK